MTGARCYNLDFVIVVIKTSTRFDGCHPLTDISCLRMCDGYKRGALGGGQHYRGENY